MYYVEHKFYEKFKMIDATKELRTIYHTCAAIMTSSFQHVTKYPRSDIKISSLAGLKL